MIAFIIFCSIDIKFNFTTGSFLSSNGTPEFRIFYEVPRKELIFIKSGSWFLAKFRITCSLRSKNNEIGDMWIVEDTVNEYEATLSKSLLRGELKLHPPPGDYKLKLVIDDINSQRSGQKETRVTVKKPKTISSIRSYEETDKVILFFEVYNFDSLPFEVQYEVGKIKSSLKFTGQSFVNPVTLEFPIDSVGFGTHKVKISSGGDKVEYVLDIEAPFWCKDYEKRVEQLYYIADPKEIDFLIKTPLDKRKEAWKAFWVRKDSIFGIGADELEAEYFSRVDYANEQFSTAQEGWRTDRGRVYIKLGKPDERITHPFEVDRPPYEVWYYYSLGFRFVFADKRGFGDYTLEYPQFWDEKIRFR